MFFFFFLFTSLESENLLKEFKPTFTRTNDMLFLYVFDLVVDSVFSVAKLIGELTGTA